MKVNASNFGGTLEPFAIVLLDRGASPQQRTVSGHQDCVLAVHGGDWDASPANTALRYLSAPSTTDGSTCVALSAPVALHAVSAGWKESTQEEECGNDSVHLSLLVNSFWPATQSSNLLLESSPSAWQNAAEGLASQ